MATVVEQITFIGEMTIEITVTNDRITKFTIVQARTGVNLPLLILYNAQGQETARLKAIDGSSVSSANTNIPAPMVQVTHPKFGTVMVRSIPSFGFFERE